MVALGMEIGLGPDDFVFDGDQATYRKGHTHPTQFLAHVYCGQTVGWMKTPLCMEVDLGTGHVVLGGVSALRERGTAATWYGSRPPRRPNCIRRVPSAPRKAHNTPSFRPMSIVATVAHLSYC